MAITGVDISRYQGEVNFDLLKTKAQFVFIRAASAKNQDAYLVRNVQEAQRVGIPYGLYFVPIPVSQTAFKVQSEYHASLLAEYGGQLLPVLDLETDGGMNKNDLGNWMEKYVKWFMDFTKIEQLEKIITYTRATWFDIEMPLTNTFWRTLLWVAHYNLVISAPKIPAEWANHKKTWLLWQYSADGNDKGHEYGAQSDDIDINRFNGDAARFEQVFGCKPGELAGQPPPQQDIINPLYQARVKYSSINMRAGPGTTFSDIGTLQGGADIPVVAESGDWSEVRGYVYRPGIAKK